MQTDASSNSASSTFYHLSLSVSLSLSRWFVLAFFLVFRPVDSPF